MSNSPRYLIFGHDTYYPTGGWGDFIVACATLDEVMAAQKVAQQKWDDVEVIDLETMAEIDQTQKSSPQP